MREIQSFYVVPFIIKDEITTNVLNIPYICVYSVYFLSLMLFILNIEG